MFSHIFIGVNALDRAVAFYRPVMIELGLCEKVFDVGRNWIVWTSSKGTRPLLIVGHPEDGKEATPGNGAMTAFLAPSRAAVDRCYALALEAGGSCAGPPGPRPAYHQHFYGCYVRDPEGNKLCFVTHETEQGDDVRNHMVIVA